MSRAFDPRLSPLFAGLSEEGYAEALDRYRARTVVCKKGDFLWRPGESGTVFGLVLSGTVTVCSDEEDGGRTILAQVTPGRTFGGSMALLGQASPVYPVAATAARVMLLSPQELRNEADGTETARALRRNFARLLAAQTLEMNARIQILSRVTMRGKLDRFFRHYGGRPDGKPFSLPFDRAGMAFFLGVDRSALSRELGRLRSEGMLDFAQNVFVWKKPLHK